MHEYPGGDITNEGNINRDGILRTCQLALRDLKKVMGRKAGFSKKVVLGIGGGFVLALFAANFFEVFVPEYTIPVIIEETATVEMWESERAPDILNEFETHVYGTFPKEEVAHSFEVLEEGEEVFGGLANRKQVKVTVERNGASVSLQLLIYSPADDGPQPTSISYNFEGNHTVIDDLHVIPSRVYAKRIPGGIKKFSEKDRGKWNERFPVEEIVKEGYATVSVYYGDVDPDYDDGFENGVHSLFPEEEWGSVSAWAWGYSQILNYIETDVTLDENKTTLGHLVKNHVKTLGPY